MRLKDRVAIVVGAGQSPGEGTGTGRYEFDVLQQGPVLGITGRF